MGQYPMVELKNVAVVNITFRKAGEMCNKGRVVVDIDNYNFAGRITDDVIIGSYSEGKYNIRYYYHTYTFSTKDRTGEIDYFVSEYEIELTSSFPKTYVENDFCNTRITFGDDNNFYELTFDDFVTEPRLMYETLNNIRDLIKTF